MQKMIDDLIKTYAKANHFSGVVLASKDGNVIYEKAFGLANVKYDLGKIKVDDKLSKYIPDFPNDDKITVEMTGRHRSGIKQMRVNYLPELTN